MLPTLKKQNKKQTNNAAEGYQGAVKIEFWKL